MKLACLARDGRPFLAVVEDDHVIDLSRAGLNGPFDVGGLLALGPEGLAAARAAVAAAPARARVELDGLSWLPPILAPGKILCLGLNYVEHADETGAGVSDYPTIFLRAATSLVGHGAGLVRPQVSQSFDYEGELVAVIGRRTRGATLENALDAVAGYSIFNDASVRDYQFRSTQWTMGKNFDGTGAFGPWFVTSDTLPPGAEGLDLTVRLNGETVQQANTRQLITSVAQSIVLISECMTLEPGDVIVTGTPGGVGMARRPQLWMQPGDVCEVEVEGVGTLRNPVVAA